MALNILHYSLLIILFASSIKTELTAENVIIAINCGGDTLNDHKGITWEKDDHFNGGQTSDFGTQFDIKLTQDQELYQTERWSGEDLIYHIPINRQISGKYVLVLKFSEVYFNSINDKVFDIHFGDTPVVRKLDVFAKVGKATAFDEFIEFEVRNNKVFIENKEAPNAFGDDNKFKITFKKGERDNPKINGIMIVKGTLSETDYDSYKSQFEELDKLRQEKEFKQREIQKKNNLMQDFEDFEDDYVDSDIAQKREGALAIFFSGKAIMMYITFALLCYIFMRSSKSSDIDEKDD